LIERGNGNRHILLRFRRSARRYDYLFQGAGVGCLRVGW
jgi:hypothetical protein